MATPNQKKGNLAEQQAYQFLTKKGLKLIEKNWQSRTGEIDLIMQDLEEIVFVEVRSRTNNNFGSATESVNYKKRLSLIKTAEIFMYSQDWSGRKNCRYDIIGINSGELEWIKNAFDADDI